MHQHREVVVVVGSAKPDDARIKGLWQGTPRDSRLNLAEHACFFFCSWNLASE